jgi:hypothetical protein
VSHEALNRPFEFKFMRVTGGIGRLLAKRTLLEQSIVGLGEP